MMMTRRDAVAALALFAEFLASARHTNAQTQAAPTTPPASPRPPVFKHDLPNVTLDDWEVTVNVVDYEPGRVGASASLIVPFNPRTNRSLNSAGWYKPSLSPINVSVITHRSSN